MRAFSLPLYAVTLLSACSAVPTGQMANGAPADQPPLVRSSPADGSTVLAPVNRLELQFAKPARLREVSVADARGTTTPIMVTAAGESTHYSIPLDGLEPGSYTVEWRASVLTSDLRGRINFLVK